MKVLVATPFSPVPPDFGGALRVYHILKQLALRYEVTVVAYGTPEDAARIRSEFDLGDVHVVAPSWVATKRRLGQLYSTFSRRSFFHLSVTHRAFAHSLQAILNREKFDVFHTEYSHLGPFNLNTDALRILDAHNVEYDNFRRMWKMSRWGLEKIHYGLESVKLKRDELDSCRSQHGILATSERDKRLFDSEIPDVPKYIVPNGVDPRFFSPSDRPFEPHSLVFTGHMQYQPNHDGIAWFLGEVMPRLLQRLPEAKLYVVGKDPPTRIRSHASNNVVVTGWVPDVRPYVYKAAAYVVPLRMGGGTRLKVAEALSMKKPIVSTRVGCEGIDVVNGESAILADNPEAFVAGIIRVLGDAALQKRLAENGHKLMKDKYDWSVIGKSLQRAYEDVAYRRKMAPGK
jgi:glycosyltransferase involved in cell wall biosynthesis